MDGQEGTASDAPEAKRFGDYEVLLDRDGKPCVLGTGSYGRTYKARHLLLGTAAAIKVIRRKVSASESIRQRFLSEGRALVRLAHDHISLLRHFGQSEDGELYYAMDFCGGGTLSQRVRRRGPRPLGEVLEIGRQACSALVAAHEAGIIHRDLKPGNIMLAHRPPPVQVKVIDFGLAQPSGGGGGSSFRGTALWASPEQLLEQPLDARSDLFSLGLVLWFLVEGKTPDDGDTAAVVKGRLDPEGYGGRLPESLPQELRDLLGRLLETDPGRRPASAAELLDVLDALCRQFPYEPVDEEEVDTSVTIADELPQLADDVPIEERYIRLTRLHRDLAGEWFEAELADGGGTRVVFVLDARWGEDRLLRRRVRVNLARLWRQPVVGLPRIELVQVTDDGLVAEFAGAGGGDLGSWLRLQRKVAPRDALPFLARVAEQADEADEHGMPGVGLMASQVRWERSGSTASGHGLAGAVPWLFPLLLEAADLPKDAAMEIGTSGGSTIVLVVPELACDRCFMLASLLYRMISGREPPAAVAHTPDAYVPFGKLSEKGNALLRDMLARSGKIGSCVEFIEALGKTEGVSLTYSGSTGARHSASASSGWPGVEAVAGAVPPPIVEPEPQPPPLPPQVAVAVPLIRTDPGAAGETDVMKGPGVLASLVERLSATAATAWPEVKQRAGGLMERKILVPAGAAVVGLGLVVGLVNWLTGDDEESGGSTTVQTVSGAGPVAEAPPVESGGDLPPDPEPAVQAALGLFVRGQAFPADFFDQVERDLLIAARDAGDPRAQFIWARLHDENVGLFDDAAESVKWYGVAADKGYANAEYNLGLLYDSGRGVEVDPAMAAVWYRRAAEQGHSYAQCKLGQLYDTGRGVEQNDAEALKWYHQAAEQGSARAQCNVGYMTASGRGVDRDDAEAVKWYRLSAEQGFARAQCNLGVMYEFGRGVAGDLAEAAGLYRQAAEQGHVIGQCNLAALYAAGRGVARDYGEALKWYGQAAEEDWALAQYKLGAFHEEGLGVPQNYAEAKKWYAKAAAQEYEDAQFKMGVFYAFGYGSRRNDAEAVRWYFLAADQGHRVAQYNLGVMFSNGRGIEQSSRQAAEWYRKAADQGYAPSQFNLGLAYQTGRGVDKNFAEAARWYSKAAKQGHADAKRNLQWLHRSR